MTRIAPIAPNSADPRAQALLADVQKALGVTPNMMKTMANSPAVLEGYLALNQSLAKGALNARTREQLALAVSQANGCDYCLSAHATLGKGAGLSPSDIHAARRADAQDPKVAAALRFAREVVAQRGNVPDEALAAVRAAGLNNAEIAEVVAHVALNTFTNYFNIVAGTEIDFPAVHASQAA